MEYTEETMSPAVTADGLADVPTVTNPVTAHGAEGSASEVDETASADETVTEAANPTEETVYRPVYNGQETVLKASEQEEITTLLQLGMKQRDFLPTYERLSFLAKEDGAVSVKAWVEQLVQDREEVYREMAMQRFGDEAGQRYYEMERRERERRYTARDEEALARTAEAQKRQERHERLATEMAALQEQYPQCRSIRDVPPSVVETALSENITLLDAYNRFTLSEQQRCERAEIQGRRAALHSTGSLRGEPSSPPNAMDAFLAGLHRRS